MSKLESKRVINGTHGAVEMDGEEILGVESFQAKDEYTLEEVNQCGDMATGHKIMGVTGKGSLKILHYNSLLLSKIGRMVRDGHTPTFTLTGSLADPDAFGAERISLTGVVFEAMELFNFEAKVKGSKELTFVYHDFIVLDKI